MTEKQKTQIRRTSHTVTAATWYLPWLKTDPSAPRKIDAWHQRTATTAAPNFRPELARGTCADIEEDTNGPQPAT